MSFSELGLSEALLRSVEALGYREATSIQRQAIPMALEGGDLLAAARTGSGKTAAFSLPILQRLEAGERTMAGPRALVLVPTRELAVQVAEAIERYGQFLSPQQRVVAIYGGAGIQAQISAAARGVDVVVATPGRLLDLVEREAFVLDRVEMLSLDEADRLLALGFSDELAAILKLLPEARQNLLFSATFPPAVVALAEAWLTEPRKVQMEEESRPVENIVQRAIEVGRNERTALLRHLLQSESWDRVLVFVAKRLRADNVTGKLAKYGIKATSIHGDMSQDQRTRALENFKLGRVRVLLATDVVARGIDIIGLPCVVNFDIPRSAADYVHRIGRTGRAGASGLAISFVTQEEDANFRLIEKRNALQIERERIEGFAPTEWNPEASSQKGKPPVKGKRKSKKDKLREAAAREAEGFTPPERREDPKSDDPWGKAIKKARQG